ncbi:DNA-protecting protein DprA [Candidatus Bealeia paramacronuclearis]|uniref:DNA-protecting protein DprA n=1 Tax=Candidatus Bealeia paramacronuclearis TaxID=1921001 RepID=A0ABZ2C3U2_9PROT|nr:DNA-protecting protein DprA [Candidatus Bealeia paramacronuclearis]
MATQPHFKIEATTCDDLTSWLRLLRSENVGPLTFHRLLKQYGSAPAALEALPQLARQGGRLKHLHIPTLQDAARELEAHEKIGATLISYSNPHYPAPLKAVESAPPLLSCLGNLNLFNRPSFGIVGARNASLPAKKMGGKFSKGLGDIGWVITSGLARGIDTAAHEGALSTGTIAVIAGGIDNIYPPENEGLYRRISQEGLIISEAPFGAVPQSSFFPRRNRIISGLSQGVLIVEAALKSGSLITARFALEQGRDVFAIPGSPYDPRARGTNQLLKQGAYLVETLEDITNVMTPNQKYLREIENEYETVDQMDSSQLEKMRQIIQENLSIAPISIDELVRECHFSAQNIWLVLLELEIAGRLVRHPGGQVSLMPDWTE